MPWTATLTAIVRTANDARQAKITVVYTDGTISEQREHLVNSREHARATVQAQLDQYTALAAFVDDPTSVGTVLTESTKTAAQLTQEADFAAFLELHQANRGMQNAVTYGYMAAGDAKVVKARTDAAAAWKPAYAKYL